MALHVTAALAHTVHLGLFEVKTCLCGGLAYNGGDGEDTLPSHTA